jgi:hypothetical protein
MRYIFAIIIPPVALFICGKPIQGVFNLIFWLISLPLLVVFGLGIVVWVLCTIHAMIVCVSYGADRRLDRVVAAIQTRPEVQTSARQ